MKQKKILLIEDDDILRQGLVLSLTSDTIAVSEAAKIAAARQLFLTQPFDLILLDCNLPDGKGIDFCRQIRHNSQVPVIFLTVNDTELEVVSAFKVGATDYVTKPFSVMVLRERIKAALRQGSSKNKVYSDRDYYFDFSAFEYKVHGETVVLSAAEQKILKILVTNQKMIIPRERLIEMVWSNQGEFIDDNALTAAVKRLRSKIGAASIKTIYGLGYMWNGSEE